MIKDRGRPRTTGLLGLYYVFSVILLLPFVFSISVQLCESLFSPSGFNTHSTGLCVAAQNEELFSVDIVKQKLAINSELNMIDELILQAKLQDARSAIGILEHKVERIRKSLTKDEIESVKLRIEGSRKAMPHKEDSLVNKTFEILHSLGVDSALQYTQVGLRQYGVSDSKISAAEKRILKEAPGVKQAQEREQIARVLKILEDGQLPDSTVDLYIIRTAQLILKAHEDSVKRIEGKNRRKEIEEQERVERATVEREMQERKIEDTRLTKEKRIAEEKERQNQDSILEEAKKKILAERKDSIISHPKTQQQETALPEIQSRSANDDTAGERINSDTVTAENRDVVRKQSSDMPLIRDVKIDKDEGSKQEHANYKTAKVYLQTLKGNQEKAQDNVMEIYDLIEHKQCNNALDNFKLNRAFIAKYVEAQVFNVLEQAVVQSVMDSACTSSSSNAGIQKSRKRISTEQEHYDRINSYMRDNNVEAAYAEFKRCEKQLKDSMVKKEFRQFKKMIEDSYKMRHPVK